MQETHNAYDFPSARQEILKTLKVYYPACTAEEEEKILQAFSFGQKAHHGQLRKSGEPYFSHSVEATKILLAIQPDVETIIACLLHDVIPDTDVSAEKVEDLFGAKIRLFCEGVSHISKVQLKKEHHKEQHTENLQKLFVAVATDVRVIFVKLSDRIHNLKTLQYLPQEKQIRIARESMEVYAPIAERLGLFEFKSQIQDLSFQYLSPKSYKKLTKEVEIYRREQFGLIQKAIAEINAVFAVENMPIIDIKGRQKNIYSTYEKMRRKNISNVSEVFDLFGIKILVQTSADCYRALGIIHSRWKPMPKRFKDYIAVTKPNGYQSLHTTVLGLAKSHLPTEIQIKTQDMDMDAEYGPAAHWAYKKTKTSNFDRTYLDRMKWMIPEGAEKGEQDAQKFFERMSQSILSDQLYVFTPNGDIINLPVGSTPIDFAYAIHSDLGNNCIGTRVNGVIKSLDYPLQNSDIVEVSTKKGRTPNPLWLKFVKSPLARSAIQNALRKTNRIESIPPKIANPEKLIKNQGKENKSPTISAPNPLSLNVVIGGEEGLSYRYAQCCKPSPEKSILAYNSRGRQFTIHELNCSSCKKLDPKRFCEAHFIVKRRFRVLAKDRKGLMRDYSSTMTNHGIFIHDIQFQRKPGNIAEWTFVVNINSDKEFSELLKEIRQVQNVTETRKLTFAQK